MSTYTNGNGHDIFIDAVDTQYSIIMLPLDSPHNSPDHHATVIILSYNKIPMILNKLDRNAKWIYKNKYLPSNIGTSIARKIIKGTAIAVSDGSYKGNIGTAAFIIHKNARTCSWVGTTICAGQPEHQDPYRAKLTGQLGKIVTLHIICNLHKICEGSVTITCDNDNMLEHCFTEDFHAILQQHTGTSFRVSGN